MTYHVKFSKFSRRDYDNLDGSQKILVDKSLRKIELQGMHAGEWSHGNLSGCKKLKHKRAGLRVIFKESDNGVEIIDIITIGKRSDEEVYKTADERLRES